jgi:serine/threonine-protein kinase
LGIPKITDFGLAKRLDDQANLTSSGAVLGTPTYMAPEQAAGKGKEIGPAADVYSLGAILYEGLTGRPPFRGLTGTETIQQVLTTEPPPPSRLQPQVPRALEAICLKCLHKEPKKRYATAEELANDLHRFLAGEAVQARRPRFRERLAAWLRRRPRTAAALILAALLGLAAAALLILGRQ